MRHSSALRCKYLTRFKAILLWEFCFSSSNIECAGRAGLLCPGNSDVDLFRYGQRIIYIDPEVPNRAFNFSMAE